jgi:hypothetical protein
MSSSTFDRYFNRQSDPPLTNDRWGSASSTDLKVIGSGCCGVGNVFALAAKSSNSDQLLSFEGAHPLRVSPPSKGG